MDFPFHSIYAHGFLRVAVGIPSLRVADPAFNAERTLLLARRASEMDAGVVLFPELGLSAYSNEDLFHQDALLEATRDAITHLVDESRELSPMVILGAPLRFHGRLFNCGVVIYQGRVLGIVPKSYLPNYREFYEKRQFTAAGEAVSREVPFLGRSIPFGNDLVFEAVGMENFVLHAEVCEDIWSPIPPSTYAALAGATVLANLSASNITVGKSEYRKLLCASQSAKCIAAYLYSAAGPGESTTDLAWDGHALIYENNDLLAESKRFSTEEQLIVADVDLGRLVQDRMRMNSFNDTLRDCRDRVMAIRRIPFDFQAPKGELPLVRTVERFPYVPGEVMVRDERCYEVYNIQVHGLMKRMAAAGIERVVIGVSGGLDSTQALMVCARTMDRLGLPRENILAYTMPGFATSTMTNQNAHRLMKALGVTATELDIRPSSRQMLDDIGHPFARGEKVFDVTFENVQAGDRTSHLFRLANFHDAIVVGTGDLSELALGWTTYGVGDHMSHYNVNGSVPKTLIQHLIRWVIRTRQFDEETSAILQSILDTEISPELVPTEGGSADRPAQSTEARIGPYELQDFSLYYITRFGFRPSKVAFLALHAWGKREGGVWPEWLPDQSETNTTLRPSGNGLRCFCTVFSRSASLSGLLSPIPPRSAPAGPSRPEGTGVHRAIPKPRFGWRSSETEYRFDPFAGRTARATR